MDPEEEDEPVDVKRELGVSPALVGAAMFEGVPRVLAPALGFIPNQIAQALTSGEVITAAPGTPLSQLAEFTRNELGEIQNFAREQGVTAPIVAGVHGGGPAYFYDTNQKPLSRLINRLFSSREQAALEMVPDHIGLRQSSIPMAFHEIGHASPIFGSDTLRKVFQGLGSELGSKSMIGHGLRASIAATALLPPGEDASGLHKFVYNNAPALVGATLVPELAEEARASFHALQGARRAGYSTLSTLSELAPAFGTYLAGAAAPVLATLFAKRVIDSLRAAAQRKHDLEAQGMKTAATMAGAEVKAPGALKASAGTAWNLGGTPPKPKTIPPGNASGGAAKSMPTAKPPSNRKFYKDLIETMGTPGRGYRLATPA